MLQEKIILQQKIIFRVKYLLVLILIAGIHAMIISPKRIDGIQYFAGTIIVPILIFITITNSKLSIRSIINYINLNFISTAILGLFSIYVVTVLGEVDVRIPSLWEDFNIVAAYYMISIFFLLTFLLHYSKKSQLFIYALILIPVLLGLFFTQTRGVWLSIIIAIAFYVLKRPKVIIPASIFIGVIVVVFFSIVMDRFLSVKNFGTDASAIGRMQAWLASVIIIKNNILWGVGFEGFIELRDSIFSYYIVPVLHSHNTYLRLWLEMGIIGFIPYLSIMVIAFVYTFKIIKKNKENKEVLMIAEGLQLSFVGLFVAFMFEPYFSLYGNSTIIIWILISITYYLHSGDAKKKLII